MYEFIVNDPSEEHFIVRKMLCSKCRGRLNVVMQELLEGTLSEEECEKLEASTKTDRLHVKCRNCDFMFSILFHLSYRYQKALNKLFEEFMGRGEG